MYEIACHWKLCIEVPNVLKTCHILGIRIKVYLFFQGPEFSFTQIHLQSLTCTILGRPPWDIIDHVNWIVTEEFCCYLPLSTKTPNNPSEDKICGTVNCCRVHTWPSGASFKRIDILVIVTHWHFTMLHLLQVSPICSPVIRLPSKQSTRWTQKECHKLYIFNAVNLNFDTNTLSSPDGTQFCHLEVLMISVGEVYQILLSWVEWQTLSLPVGRR